MPNEVLANEVLAPLPEVALSEPDYRAFCAALEASARGRAFLAEYAKRNRHANTEMLMAALDRLEALVRSQASTTEADRIRQELRALLAAMRAAQPTIDASAAAIKAAKLAAMIGFVQHRIESIVANEQSPLPTEVAALVLPDDAAADPARSRLAVVPHADEPELPIPTPVALPTVAFSLVQERESERPKPDIVRTAMVQPVAEIPQPKAKRIEPAPIRHTSAIVPENLFDSAARKPAIAAPVVAAKPVVIEPIEQTTAVEPVVAKTTVVEIAPIVTVIVDTPVVETAAAAPSEAPRRAVAKSGIAPAAPVARSEAAEKLPADDPLALIMTLSEAERIALFT